MVTVVDVGKAHVIAFPPLHMSHNNDVEPGGNAAHIPSTHPS